MSLLPEIKTFSEFQNVSYLVSGQIKTQQNQNLDH
jgi:hypothetical protein